jgi:hypothetical protein
MQSFLDYLPVYATNASGDWVATTLGDNNTIIGSLALDSLGHPHVALALANSGTIRHSHFDGSQWLTEDLFGPSDSFASHCAHRDLRSSLTCCSRRDSDPASASRCAGLTST